MGSFDDLIPAAAAATPSGGAGSFDDLIPKKKTVGAVEAGGRGVGSTFAEQGNVLGAAAGAPAVLADAVANLFRERPRYPVQDAYFKNVYEPVFKNAVEHYEIKPEEELSTGAKVANVGGRVVGMVPSMIAASGAPQSVQLPKLVSDLFKAAVVAQPSFAVPSTVTRAQQLLESGVDPKTVAQASAVNLGANTAMGMAPISVPGRFLTRATTGAAINTAGGAGQRAAEGFVLGPQYEKQAQPAFGLEQNAPDAALGAVMAALFGSRARVPERPVGTPKPDLKLEEKTPRPEPVPREPDYDPDATVKAVNEALFRVPEGAPPAPRLQLIPKGQEAPAGRPPEPDVSQVPMAVPPEATVEGQPRKVARDLGRDERGREIPPTQGEEFRIAESQRERKQGAQDVGVGRDLRESRAGGSTSAEGTHATSPQAFTFLDVKRDRRGYPTGTGPEVKIEAEVPIRDAKGKETPGYRVSYMRDLEGGGRELVYEDVPQDRVSQLSRPYNPRFAQDVAASTYEPPRGVGAGDEQPAPRAAAQRITTEPSPEVIPADRAAHGGEATPARRVGEDVTDLAFNRLENKGGTDAGVSGEQVARRGGAAGGVRTGREPLRLRGDEQPGRDARQQGDAQGGRNAEDARGGLDRGPARQPPVEDAHAAGVESDRDSLAAFEQERDQQFRENVAKDMRGLATSSGWVERGGQLIRHKHSEVAGDETISRTKWIGAEWFAAMRSALGRKGLTERDQIMLAVEKWLGHEPLNPNERRTVNHMLGEVMDLRDQSEFAGLSMERAQAADTALELSQIERTPQNLYDVDYLSRMDPATLERLALQHGDDTTAFMRAVAEESQRADPLQAGKNAEPNPAQAEPERPGARGVDRAEPPRGDLAAGAGRLGDAQGVREDVRRETGGDGGQSEARPAFGLDQPTEQHLRARDAEQRRVAEEKARKENAPSPEEFKLAGSDRPADQAEAHGQQGLFDKGSLSLNPFANIGQLANDLSRAWTWAVGDAKTWTNKISELTKDIASLRSGRPGDQRNIVRKATSYLFDSAAGDMRAAIRSAGDSATATAVMDKLHNMSGSGKATAETLHDAVRAKVNEALVQLHRLLGDDMIHDEAAMRQIANLVRNPGEIRAGTKIHDAANGIRKMLDETLKYMKAAGIDVGEVKGGYYPREFDLDAIVRSPQAFIDAVARAYRDSGMTPEAANMAAKELHDGMLYGETDTVFKTDRGASRAPFLKGRLFGKDVDQPGHPLNKFLLSDPALSLSKYMERAAKRAEIARRFGDNFANWPELTKKIREEGGGDILQKLSEYVALDVGLKNAGASPGVMRTSSILRTWGALSFLEKATLSSLTEFMVPALRSGNVLDMGRMFKNTMADLFNKAGNDAAARRSFAEDLGLLSGHISSSLASARFAGGEPIGRIESKVLDAFFKRTGLNQWTDATRVGASDNARVFVRRLAKEMSAGDSGKLTSRFLAELGVPSEQAKDFAKYVISKNDGMPGVGDLNGSMGDLYRTAVRKFVSQSIMDPTHGSRPKWMSHPMGAVIGQLQAFNYAFYENVLKRNLRLGKEALTGADYTAIERAQLLAPTMMLPLVTAAAFAIGEARDAVFGDPKRRQDESTGEKVLKAVSRGTPIAPIDQVMNYISSARYSRTATESFAGPALGTAARAVDAARDYFLKNSEKTNTQERRALRAAWDVVVEPTVNLALYGLPSAPALKALGAVLTQVAGSSTAREAVIEPIAGPQKEKGSAGGGRSSARSSTRDSGRSSTR